MYYQITLLVLVSTCSVLVSSQHTYEDNRCRCVCPSPAAVLNNTDGADRTPISKSGNVPPSKCDCTTVILPYIADQIKGLEQEFCRRCDCKSQTRNTTIIKVVVIIVIWVIMLLVVYMGFLICLDPLINKRAKASYQEHTNEDDEGSLGGPSQQLGARGNVLNRVTHQQDKWKRQVREQRRNIYDRHTMLN